MSDGLGRKDARRVGLVVGLAAVVVVTALFSGDDAPSRRAPAAYTQHVVQSTIDLYEREGRQAALEYVNSMDSVDGQWYPVIIGEDGYTIAHHNPRFIRRDPSERVDSTGYFYGYDLLAATDEGHWVSYVLLNPETGREQRKHTWVVHHDGLIFGSGWYEANGS